MQFRLLSLPLCALLLTGCAVAAETPTAPKTPPPFSFDSNVAADASGVHVDTVVHATSANGSVESATLTYKGEEKKQSVAGVISGDEWIAEDLLEPGQTYTLAVTGRNEAGKESTAVRTFSTEDLTLDQQTYPSVVPLQGETVGVGMPIIVRFDLPVYNKGVFERNLKVVSVPAVEGSWSWMSDYEVHYRPKHYWPPGTKVHLIANLNSLPAGKGVYGQQDQDVSFTIGRSVVSTMNIAQHTLSVAINGKTVRTMPATSGKDGYVTRSGTKLIMAKFTSVRMDAASIGIDEDSPEYYDLADVKYAMRVTNSGEFIHAAPWSKAAQGLVNVSHGCVGLSIKNAKWYFHQSKRGDVVKFVGSSRGLEKQNGWTDWNVSYATYKAGSAL